MLKKDIKYVIIYKKGGAFMPIVQTQIYVPPKIYAQWQLGQVKIMGLAKAIDTNQVVKHLDTVKKLDSETQVAEASAQAVAQNSKSNVNTGAVLGIVAVAAIIAGVTIHYINKANQKKVEAFKRCLNDYVSAANDLKLSAEIIDNLIKSMDKLKLLTRRKVRIQFSTDELSALIECLCNHTQTLAQANNLNVSDTHTEEEQKDVLLKLRRNLVRQKAIFDKAA